MQFNNLSEHMAAAVICMYPSPVQLLAVSQTGLFIYFFGVGGGGGGKGSIFVPLKFRELPNVIMI